METNANTFYRYYVKEYHEVRAHYLHKLLSEINQLNAFLKNKELQQKDVIIPLTTNTKFIIQADLRQNYFHSIETFFEFFFALLPEKGKVQSDDKIVRKLIKANWRNNYKKIEDIANGNLDNLREKVNSLGYEISLGHYLFYPGTYSKEKFGGWFLNSVPEWVNAIEKIIKIIAVDFCQRDEYNAYKHTMRVFPNFDSLHFLDPETMEEKMNFDISNSASYQLYNDKESETIVKTKVFDPIRDYKMSKICSRLIYNMVELRNIMFNKSNESNQDKTVAIVFFNEANINESNKHNVEIQDLVFTTKMINRSQ